MAELNPVSQTYICLVDDSLSTFDFGYSLLSEAAKRPTTVAQQQGHLLIFRNCLVLFTTNECLQGKKVGLGSAMNSRTHSGSRGNIGCFCRSRLVREMSHFIDFLNFFVLLIGTGVS